MFKRVQKRARKLEKEEEHGLDSEMKEVLGLQSTDSEESEFSSSESGSDSKEESRDAASDAEDKEDEGEGLESLEDEGSDGEEGSEDESEFPLMSVTEAVSDPLYLVSIDPDVRACILCPGKLLKNTRMADVHKSSKAHNRRFTRFVELVSNAGPGGDVRGLIRQLNEEGKAEAEPKAREGELSKRAEKRKAKLAAIKAKREKHKDIVKQKRKQAEKAQVSGDASKSPAKPNSGVPPRKRRKVENASEEKQATEPAKTSTDDEKSEDMAKTGSFSDSQLAAPSKVSEDKKSEKKSSKKAKGKTKEEQPTAPPAPVEEPATKHARGTVEKVVKSKTELKAPARANASNVSKPSGEAAKPKKPRQKKKAT